MTFTITPTRCGHVNSGILILIMLFKVNHTGVQKAHSWGTKQSVDMKGREFYE